MSHTYVAYIDESGDDGLGKFREPNGRGGASKWLVISAIIFRAVHNLEAVTWRNEINAGMPDRSKRELHFTDFNHGQRLSASKILATKPIRIVSVFSHKPSIPNGTYTSKNQLYFYLTRHLVERISWLCRDMRARSPEGDGRVKITFSRRGGMSYPDFRDYLRRVKENTTNDNRIHWPVIDIDAVDAKDHSTSASLQLADIAASAFAYGVEPDRYGNSEARYAENLRRITYERGNNFFSYGVKFLPNHEDIPPEADFGRFISVFR